MRRIRRAHANPISLFSFQDIITAVTGIIILLALLMVVELAKRPFQSRTTAPDPSQHAQDELRQLEERIASMRTLIDSSTAFTNDVASLPGAQIQRTEQDIRKEIAALEAAIAQLGDDERRTISEADLQDAGLASKEALLTSLQDKNQQLKRQLDSARRSNQVVYSTDPKASKSAWLVDLRADRIEVGRPKREGIDKTFSSRFDDDAFIEWAKQKDRHGEYFVLLVRPDAIRVYEHVSASLRDAGFSLGFDLIDADASVLEVAVTKEAQ